MRATPVMKSTIHGKTITKAVEATGGGEGKPPTVVELSRDTQTAGPNIRENNATRETIEVTIHQPLHWSAIEKRWRDNEKPRALDEMRVASRINNNPAIQREQDTAALHQAA